MPLQASLEEYYKNYAEIAANRMASAKKVAHEIRDELRQFLSTNSNFPIEGIFGAGSAYEGLKVVGPDEFDMQSFLTIPGLRVVDDILGPSASRVPDYTLIDNVGASFQSFVTPVGGYSCLNPVKIVGASSLSVATSVGGYSCLDPNKVLSHFQGKITQFLNGYRRSDREVRLRKQGPAMTVEVKYVTNTMSSKFMSIDFVPVVVIGQRQFVAKPHPDPRFSLYWRYSFTSQERDRLNCLPQHACHRKVLQTFKAIRLNHQELSSKLRTYICKTVLLHLLDNPTLDWSPGRFAERFHDYMMALKSYLDSGNLPHYKRELKEVNLLEHHNATALGNASNFIARAQRTEYRNLLLKRDYVSRG